MEKTDLVISNLIRYFYAVSKVDEIKLKIEALDQTMGVHSPSISDEHGYSGTRDEKLLNYSVKRSNLEEELKKWKSEKELYYIILHLEELDDIDNKMLEYLYKDKLPYEKIAKLVPFTNKAYVSRKKDSILEKLSKFI